MAQDKLYGGFSQLPTWAKGVVAVVGVGFIVATTYVIYKTISNNLSKPDLSPDQARADLRDLKRNGIVQKSSDTQISAWAEIMHEAIADLGTDEEAVYGVFKQLKNEADLYRLIELYGVREEGGFFYNPEKTLVARLSSDLSASERSKVNNIFSSKGIKFRL
jgi:hypothetical protein